MVFTGDSIIELWSAVPGVNAGIRQQTSAQILARFERDVLSKNPSVVVILAGTNDLFRQETPNVNNVSAMADMAAAANACVILGTLPPIPASDAIGQLFGIEGSVILARLSVWNSDIEMLRKAQSYRVADFFAALEGKPELFDDGLHPNAAGYEVLRKVVQPVIDSCPGRQR